TSLFCCIAILCYYDFFILFFKKLLLQLKKKKKKGPSGYRPPHQRGDAPVMKLPDSEDYSRRERGAKSSYRDRDREREATTAKTSADKRTLSREDMGKGYDRRPQFGKEDDDRRSNEKKLGESPRDYGSGSQRKGYSGNRRKEDSSWAHSNVRANVTNGSTEQARFDNREATDHGVHSVDYPHKRDANHFKRDSNNGFGSKNSTVRSQSLKTYVSSFYLSERERRGEVPFFF
ncbi:hypothetical protein RFI_21360, partial [Reticulomyxa filosa]